MRRFAGWLLTALLAGLAGCAGPGPVSAPVKDVPLTAANAESFALEGRLSVHYGDDSLSGKFSWTHAPEQDEVNLASPLGNQIAQIVRDRAGVTLTNSNKQQFHARDVETLTETRLGWRMPLAGLIDWVRGRPQGATAAVQRDAAGRPASIKEDGWVVELSYDGEARQPQRLFLNYTRAEKPLDIRIAIDTRG
ncbi:MAG TPA: lipoprotein insertase outer membrane protein LolB [Burkholderiales bacterium]|nr:lipoprotein insertase outer membrane protein LolB [Burkholderiales bacterium]